MITLYIAPNGDKWWEADYKFHRIGGPAVVTMDGGKRWYQHGLKHNDTGPAVVRRDGANRWYIKGVAYDEFEYMFLTKLVDT